MDKECTRECGQDETFIKLRQTPFLELLKILDIHLLHDYDKLVPILEQHYWNYSEYRAALNDHLLKRITSIEQYLTSSKDSDNNA